MDWNFTSIPQAGLDNRVLELPRGFVLGGSSSISKLRAWNHICSCINLNTDLLTWNRGSDELWDSWANLTGDPGWSWASVENFYLKVSAQSFVEICPIKKRCQTSQLVAPADGHNASLQEIPAAHGNGPVLVSVAGFPLPDLDDRVINSSKELGGRFAFNQDVNAGIALGFSQCQAQRLIPLLTQI